MTLPEIAGIEVSCTVREGHQDSTCECNFDNSAFAVVVQQGRAIFRFKYPLSSLDEAEHRVSDFLTSWEGDLLLQGGPVRRRILVVGSSAPGYGERGYGYLHGTLTGPLAEANTRRYTPWKRHRYWEVPLVASLIHRYEDFRRGKELLSVLGYITLSALEHAFGGRSGLAQALNVERRILAEIGRLVSTVGTYQSARKITGRHEFREFTEQEQWWLESVIKEILRRSGETLTGRHNPARLTFLELPPLQHSGE